MARLTNRGPLEITFTFLRNFQMKEFGSPISHSYEESYFNGSSYQKSQPSLRLLIGGRAIHSVRRLLVNRRRGRGHLRVGVLVTLLVYGRRVGVL